MGFLASIQMVKRNKTKIEEYKTIVTALSLSLSIDISIRRIKIVNNKVNLIAA